MPATMPIPIPPGGTIQIVPPGLMDLLQLKQLGRLPGKLNDQVAGVLELRDWYLQSRKVGTLALPWGVQQTLAPAVAAITVPALLAPFQLATGGNAAVPQGQVWFVDEMTVSCTLSAAASSIRIACALNGLTGDFQVLGPDMADVVNAHANRKVTAIASRPFWAAPGDIFSAVIYDVTTGTNESLSLTLRATPMKL